MFYLPGQTRRREKARRHAAPLKWARKFLALSIAVSIVSVALVNKAGASDFCLRDPTFGHDGKVFTNFSVTNGKGSTDNATAVAVQPDGKIVVLGSNNDGFALARYNADGSLDTTFSGDGKVTHSFTPGTNYVEHAVAVAVQTDGKIVAAGTVIRAGYDFALLRYNSDGSLDDGTANDSTPGNSFGRGGEVITNFQNESYELARAMVIQPNGKIIVSGTVNLDLAGPSPAYQVALARYNSNGSLDRSFGSGGKVITEISSTYHSAATAVAVQNDGKIIAGGYTYISENLDNSFLVLRYNTDGTLDSGTANDSTPADSFGDGGKVTTLFHTYRDAAPDMLLLPNGKIVIAGSVRAAGESYDFGLVRYNNNGSLDRSFGNGGKVVTDFSGNRDIAQSIARQSNGKLVVAGRTNVARAGYYSSLDFALARYNSNGSLDATFGGDGKVITDAHYRYDDAASAVAIQPDGKIVAAGTSRFNSDRLYDFALVRYLADGDIPEPKLSGLTLSRHRASCSETLYGKVTLCSPASAGGLTVRLSDTLDAASVPSHVVVPEGETSAIFEIATAPVSAKQTGSIVASLGTITRSAPLVIQPVGISSLSVNPNIVKGPRQVTGTVLLSCQAPAGGVTVRVESNNPAVAYPLVSSFTIPAGALSREFRINTTDVSSPRTANITATANGTRKGALLTVH
jgi:uncharacterized delta-60 repeat protein